MRQVIEDLVKKGPSDKEMRRAKEYYLGRRAMDLQGDASLAGYFTLEEVYRLRFKTEAEVARLIEKVTAKDVSRLAERLMLNSNLVTSTVG
ncbi:MAG: insulinase family protein [Proteobacteria bacterium]|nr:MAG: insulinase family protein [Pseudomonadota bacterium]